MDEMVHEACKAIILPHLYDGHSVNKKLYKKVTIMQWKAKKLRRNIFRKGKSLQFDTAKDLRNSNTSFEVSTNSLKLETESNALSKGSEPTYVSRTKDYRRKTLLRWKTKRSQSNLFVQPRNLQCETAETLAVVDEFVQSC